MPQRTEEAHVAHISDEDQFVTAYDTRTGKKVGRVPRAHLDIFPHLDVTPKARVNRPKPAEKPKLPDFISSENTERKAEDA